MNIPQLRYTYHNIVFGNEEYIGKGKNQLKDEINKKLDEDKKPKKMQIPKRIPDKYGEEKETTNKEETTNIKKPTNIKKTYK